METVRQEKEKSRPWRALGFAGKRLGSPHRGQIVVEILGRTAYPAEIRQIGAQACYCIPPCSLNTHLDPDGGPRRADSLSYSRPDVALLRNVLAQIVGAKAQHRVGGCGAINEDACHDAAPRQRPYGPIGNR